MNPELGSSHFEIESTVIYFATPAPKSENICLRGKYVRHEKQKMNGFW